MRIFGVCFPFHNWTRWHRRTVRSGAPHALEPRMIDVDSDVMIRTCLNCNRKQMRGIYNQMKILGLDSVMYFVPSLTEGIEFWQKAGFELTELDEKNKWCNLHNANRDFCLDLTETIESQLYGTPYFLVEDVRKFVKNFEVEEIFEIRCGWCASIKGPGFKVYVLDLTKEECVQMQLSEYQT